MTNSKLESSKQKRERQIIEAFSLSCSDFPEGKIAYGDKPDAIVCGSRNIGIELVGFDHTDGRSKDSERQQSHYRHNVIKKAQVLYEDNGGKPRKFSFGFEHILKQGRKLLPAELAQFAQRVEDEIRQDIFLNLNNAPPEVNFAYNYGQVSNSNWEIVQSYNTPLMDKTRLKKIIKEKEGKCFGYKPCNAYWLIISIDFFNPAQDQQIEIDGLDVDSKVFERIFIFRHPLNEIMQVQ